MSGQGRLHLRYFSLLIDYTLCESHLETSGQIVVSIYGTTPELRIHRNLYLFLVVTTLEYIITTHNNTL